MVVFLADVGAVEAPLIAEASPTEAFVVLGILEEVFVAGEAGTVDLPAAPPIDPVAQISHVHLHSPFAYRRRGKRPGLSPRDFRTCRKRHGTRPPRGRSPCCMKNMSDARHLRAR